MKDLVVVVMMTRRTRMRLEVVVKTKREIIPIIYMIITIEIREEEAGDKDLGEEAFVGNVFTEEKKDIENLNVHNAKEEKKARLELHMLMKMPDHHILKMLKEEKS